MRHINTGPIEVALRREHAFQQKCAWRDHPEDRKCGMRCIEGTPVCYWHALRVSVRIQEVIRAEQDIPPDDADRWPTDAEREAERAREIEIELERRQRVQPFVYYLMLSPTTVKIGTTRNLRSRIASQGGQLQYVVALEFGDRDVEKARHDQFQMERHGMREVFTVSADLQAHIEALAPRCDELMEVALAMPEQPADTPK